MPFSSSPFEILARRELELYAPWLTYEDVTTTVCKLARKEDGRKRIGQLV